MPKFLTWWWVRLIIGIFIVGLASSLPAIVQGFVDGATGADPQSAPDPTNMPWYFAIGAAIAAMAGYMLHLRFIERQLRVDIGTGRGVLGNAVMETVAGVAIGAGLMGLVAVVLALAGAYDVTAVNPVSAIVPALMVGIFAGVTEEILLRGLIFRLSEEWMGSLGALILSSLLFGFAHGANANATLFSSVAIALEAGVLLGLAYMFTRRLWLVIGIHMAWNTTLGGIFGMPVSGYALPSILEANVEGPDLLTGGAFGPEASITAIAICGLAAVAFGLACWKRGEWKRPGWRKASNVEAMNATFD